MLSYSLRVNIILFIYIFQVLFACMQPSIELYRSSCEDSSYHLIVWSSIMIQNSNGENDAKEYKDLLLLGLYDSSIGCKERYPTNKEKLNSKLGL